LAQAILAHGSGHASGHGVAADGGPEGGAPGPGMPPLRLALGLTSFWSTGRALCNHEGIGLDLPAGTSGGNSTNYTVLQDGEPITSEIGLNSTRLFYYENYNATTMNLPEGYRRLIISLEGCAGVVYLFVRQARRCWPAPHSCCRPLPNAKLDGVPLVGARAPPCNPGLYTTSCDWTSFHSVIDGTQDGAPTFFEVPLTVAKYFLSVFAPRGANLQSGVVQPRFRLMALADVGAYPRPGHAGVLRATQLGEQSIELQWERANFMPGGVSDLRSYYVFSSLMLPRETRQSAAVLLSPSKIMNTACGLERNAVQYSIPLSSAVCTDTVCSMTISGMVPRRRYMLNVVAESHRLHNSSYSGIIVSTDWSEASQLLSDRVTSLVGAICGTVFGVVVMGYLWILKLYK